jgi:hypothetical protein
VDTQQPSDTEATVPVQPTADGYESTPPEGFRVADWRYLGDASDDLDVGLANLITARTTTVAKLCTLARHLRQNLPTGHSLDVVAFGSLARLEASDASDFDYLLLAHRLVSPDVVGTYRAAANRAGQEAAGLTAPGLTGTFGHVVSASALTQHIGLEEDTNASHTRRMLVLEESISLYLPRDHDELVKNILERYILEYRGSSHPSRVPRFLLNDAARYWYQMTVDYQAKRWTELPPTRGPGQETDDDPRKWGLRFLKLVLSRKVAYAGTVASILLVAHEAKSHDGAVTVGALRDRFALTAMDRLAEIAHLSRDDLTARDALKTIFEVTDWFSGRLADREFRTLANSVLNPRSEDNPAEFREAVDRSTQLHDALIQLFFDTKLLRDASRKYLLF